MLDLSGASERTISYKEKARIFINKYRGWILSAIVIVHIARSLGLESFIPQEALIITTVVVMFYILDDIADRVQTGDSHVRFNDQNQIYADLERWVDDNKVKNARFYQYSGTNALHLVEKLLGSGTSVELYVQNLETVRLLKLYLQEDLIRVSQARLLGDMSNPAKGSQLIQNLKIYCVDPPITFRAIIFDQDLIAVGWYWYHYGKQYQQPEQLEIKGHDAPGLLINKNCSGFAYMMQNLASIYDNPGMKKKLIFPAEDTSTT
jgi:hypothetical protein